MKTKYLALLALPLLLGATTEIRGVWKVANLGTDSLSAGGGVTPAACSVAYTNAAAITTENNFGVADPDRFYGGQGDWVGSTNICSITFYLTLRGGDVSTKGYVAKIWVYNHASGLLESLLGTSATVAGNNSWSDTPVTFTFASPVTVANGTYYALTCSPTNAADSGNYIGMAATADGQIEGITVFWKADGTFSGYETTDMKIGVGGQ